MAVQPTPPRDLEPACLTIDKMLASMALLPPRQPRGYRVNQRNFNSLCHASVEVSKDSSLMINPAAADLSAVRIEVANLLGDDEIKEIW